MSLTQQQQKQKAPNKDKELNSNYQNQIFMAINVMELSGIIPNIKNVVSIQNHWYLTEQIKPKKLH